MKKLKKGKERKCNPQTSTVIKNVELLTEPAVLSRTSLIIYSIQKKRKKMYFIVTDTTAHRHWRTDTDKMTHTNDFTNISYICISLSLYYLQYEFLRDPTLRLLHFKSVLFTLCYVFTDNIKCLYIAQKQACANC
jgi:hypothetical protein